MNKCYISIRINVPIILIWINATLLFAHMKNTNRIVFHKKCCISILFLKNNNFFLSSCFRIITNRNIWCICRIKLKKDNVETNFILFAISGHKWLVHKCTSCLANMVRIGFGTLIVLWYFCIMTIHTKKILHHLLLLIYVRM